MSARRPEVILIAAVARNGVIGRDNALPWRLRADLQHFRAVTLGHPLLMGRKTWESLGRPLPGRRNMVISRSSEFRAEGAEVFPSADAALAAVGEHEKVFVIGGAEDAALFKSTDGGETWQELSALRTHSTGQSWQPGAGGMCLHTIIQDPANPDRIYVAISAAGAFRTDDGGESWKPINKGLRSDYIPDEDAEVGHCVHNLSLHPSRPDTVFMQKHWDVMRTDNAGDEWHEVSGNLPSDFGFPISVHAHEPETIYVVPIKSDAEPFPPEGKLRVYRSRSGGNEWEPLTKGLPQQNCYVNILRDAMSVDSLDPCGLYFGTTGGQVYASSDSGDNWKAIVRDLPAVVSIEVQTLS